MREDLYLLCREGGLVLVVACGRTCVVASFI